MEHTIKKIADLSTKSERVILGSMSGTSLDGLDLALCRFKAYGLDTQVKLEAFKSYPYDQTLFERLKEVCFDPRADIGKIARLNQDLAQWHAEKILDFLGEFGWTTNQVDAIASHGQTVFHEGQSENSPACTFQIGDGDVIAVQTGIVTLSDFRMKHVAVGGEGAPLVPYGDLILFSDDLNPVLLINIGGISNFTQLPAKQTGGKIVFSDLGPGNTLMNQWAQHAYGKMFDEGGRIAKQGIIDELLYSELLGDPFFLKPYPKTTGPEYFNLEAFGIKALKIPSQTVMNTLNHFTAKIIGDLIYEFKEKNKEGKIYITGGGVFNPFLMNNILIDSGDAEVETSLPFGIGADSKEAVVFALLANETLCYSDLDYTKFGLQNIRMGKISIPS